jgi:chaperonin GroES
LRQYCCRVVDGVFRKEMERRKMMKFRPLNDRVLVLRIDEEQKTSGGIIIPDTAKEKPQQGTIVSVGPGKLNKDGKRVAPQVQAGDTIFFTKYGGTDIKLDGVDHIIMREDDILAVID